MDKTAEERAKAVLLKLADPPQHNLSHRINVVATAIREAVEARDLQWMASKVYVTSRRDAFRECYDNACKACQFNPIYDKLRGGSGGEET